MLELADDVPKAKSSIFEKSVILYEDNQGTIALTVASQMQPHTNHIAIKYHHFQIFVDNGVVKIKHMDMREQVEYFFMKPLDSEFV